jgi:hypothetical protein
MRGVGRRGFLAGVVGLVAGARSALGQEPAIGLSQAVGRLARERSFAESGAGLLKQFAAGDRAAMIQGQRLYADAKASFDELIVQLQTDLDQGTMPEGSAALRMALEAAVERRLAFSRHVDASVRIEQDAKPAILDALAGGAGDIITGVLQAARGDLEEYRAGDELRRKSIADPAGGAAVEGVRGVAGVRASSCCWCGAVGGRRRAPRTACTPIPCSSSSPGCTLPVDPAPRRRRGRPLPGHRLGRQGPSASGPPRTAPLLRTLRLPAGPGNVGKAYAAAISPTAPSSQQAGGSPRVGGPERLPVRPGERAAAAPGRRAASRRQPPRLLARRQAARRRARRQQRRAADRPRDGPGRGRGPGLRRRQLRGRVRPRRPARDHELRRQGPPLRPGPTPPEVRARAGRRAAVGVAFSPDGAQLAVGYADTAAVDVLDAAALGRLFAADTGGVDNGTLAMVAWSADGSALLAAGGWQVGGEYRVRRWAGGGRGAAPTCRSPGAR